MPSKILIFHFFVITVFTSSNYCDVANHVKVANRLLNNIHVQITAEPSFIYKTLNLHKAIEEITNSYVPIERVLKKIQLTADERQEFLKKKHAEVSSFWLTYEEAARIDQLIDERISKENKARGGAATGAAFCSALSLKVLIPLTITAPALFIGGGTVIGIGLTGRYIYQMMNESRRVKQLLQEIKKEKIEA